jgi:hypothetical protein
MACGQFSNYTVVRLAWLVLALVVQLNVIMIGTSEFMGTPDTWYAYFALRGSFDPADITRRVGVSPTDTVKEGEPGRYAKALKCSHWELRSRLDMQASLESHVKDVLDQLDTNKTGFEQLSRELGGTMQLVGYFSEREPGVHFEREIVERIAQYALSIDCDFYNYR